MSDRYVRQTSVPGVGAEGQERLAAARVLCIGAGGLGAPAALYLAGAGIGTLGIVDDDTVELSNLHRQVIHRTADIGTAKVDSAQRALTALNPEITVRTHRTRLTRDTVLEVFRDYDIIVDGSDNFDTRYITSDACTLLGIPHVWASVLGSGGQLSVFDSTRGPVYRDLYPDVPAPGSVPSCAEGGVLGVVPGILGVAMAAEVLKLVLGYGTPLIGTVLIYDMTTAAWEQVPVAPNPDVYRPQSESDIGAGLRSTVTVRELTEALADRARGAREFQLIDVREPWEAEVAAIPGSRLVPLGQLLDGSAEVPAGADVYVYCKAGGRSARAAAALSRRGITVHDVVGGIDAWARQIEPDMPRY
ncbi:molybdopterin-synthase adenylyltransferase MoeB [Brevibacterium daeguense]|uniref:Molybdopterin-synthase adenylyltransferase MoeB n=1 Tax=Brevibacterium daeguense TaxID=909936 RepID=A0ABP8EJU4_9MICO|nr:ThiF family adenylyltransferase [Brevibacterium daeguense]